MAGMVLVWGCLLPMVVQSASDQCTGLHGVLSPWFVLVLVFAAADTCIVRSIR